MTRRSPQPIVLALALVSLGLVGCRGPVGPPGPPGPAGAPLTFYVVDGAVKVVAASVTDVETIQCAAGDAATGWAMEGAGLASGPAASGHRTVVPVLDGSVPSGFTFRYVCSTSPSCQITHRVICADLTP